jgi:hypothetical protein
MKFKRLNNYSLTLSGLFDIYDYDEKGQRINSLRWKQGSIGRFRGTSQTLSFSLNNEKVKKWFTKKEKDENDVQQDMGDNFDEEDFDNLNAPPPEEGQGESNRGSLRKAKEKEGDYDENGYLLVTIPWSLNVNYSFGFSYDTDKERFNKEKRRYPYKKTQNLGISGNINPTKNWSITFNTGYDFDNKKFSPTQLSINRLMHCWTMTASLIPVGPYKSYSFTIAVNSTLLQDLKYSQSSNYRDSMNWGN